MTHPSEVETFFIYDFKHIFKKKRKSKNLISLFICPKEKYILESLNIIRISLLICVIMYHKFPSNIIVFLEQLKT